MNDDRIDFGPLLDGQLESREQRVVTRVMTAVSTRAVPRADLVSSIVAVGRPSLAVAATVALAALLIPRVRDAAPTRPPTVGTALGIPLAADRVIRSAEPASAQELLAALEEGG
jgi:hypothetical protein